jgi:hypothetical protein
MEKDIFGLMHLVLTCFTALYGIFFKKSTLDKLYIYYILVVNISWTFYNGECLLSLLHKELNNVKKDSSKSIDIMLWFDSDKHYEIFIWANSILIMFSVIRVFYRNNIPPLMIFIFLFMNLTYLLLTRHFNDCKNLTFLTIQGIYKIYYVYLLIYAYYNV